MSDRIEAVAHSYPLMLEVSDRLIVIVGGGAVAARKITGLLEAGAKRVRVVAKSFERELPAGVERIVDGYRSEHLEGAGLVFAATDSEEVNAAIVRDSRQRGVLVNRADFDEDEPGDFSTPAVLRDGPVTITVSTGGSAALAARVRDELEKTLDERWVKLAEALVELRPVIRERVYDDSKRREVFLKLSGDEAARIAGAEGLEGLRRWISQRYPEMKA